MEELERVTFEQAKELKELGFPFKKIPYSKKYEIDSYEFKASYCPELADIVEAPLLELVHKWFRDEKKMLIIVGPIQDMEHSLTSLLFKRHFIGYSFYIDSINDNTGILYSLRRKYTYKTYEEALSAGIDEAIKILKYDSKNI